MSEVTVELQRAIYQALIGSPALAAAMGGSVRAYDRVPPVPVFPYITISDSQTLDAGDTCEPDRFEVFVDLHVWSRAVGMIEAKTISGIVRGIILSMVAVNFWLLSAVEFQTMRHMPDPDGLTTHSVLTFRFLLDPT